MKKTLIGLLGSTVICVLFLAGCIDEHYGEDSNTIVTNLTGYAWERTFQIRTEDGRDAEVCEHYEFGLNGKASCKSRTTCDGEEVEEHVHYFRYDFITPNNRYLLLDYCYWQIDRISSSVLSIYETFENPVVVTGEGRLDHQTAMGKAPVGVAKLGRKYGAKTIAFAGSVTKEAVACNEAGIDAFFPIVRGISTLEEAMDPDTAKANMAATAEQVFRLL